MKLKLPKNKILRYFVYFLTPILTLVSLFYFFSFVSEKLNPPASSINYGVTFSPLASESLGQNWKEVYTDILDDLKVRKLRIPSYWTSIESQEGQYDYSQTDYMVEEAAKRNARIILAVGMRQPRWPECHLPEWVNKLEKGKKQEKIKEFITKVIERYKDNSAVVAFQVENEPLFPIWAVYCDSPNPEFFKSEVSLARSLTSKTIMTSASGEWDIWIPQMQVTDELGISLYRRVHNPYTGYFYYPLIPGFYSLKSNFSRLFAPGNKKTVITELQAEPWFGDYDPVTMPAVLQKDLFTIGMFEDNVEYARKTSFDEIYLWGVEWWHLMKQKGDSEYWDYAKTLIQ